MGWAAVAAGAVQLISGIVANHAASGDRDAAQNAANNAAAAINQLEIPDVEKQKLLLNLPQVMGQYFPQQEVAQALGPSAMQNISTDPRLQQAQMNALDTLSKLGQTGLSAQDQATLNQLRRDTGQQEQSREQGILQNLAQRGQASGGLELAQKLASSQAAADRQSAESDRIAAMAQNKALQAISQAGSLGGQIQAQQFGQQAQQANAADEIAKFNAMQQAGVQQRNVGASNQAQQQNLANAQRINEAQVGLQNQQQIYNTGLQQQQFENQKAKAALQTGQYANQQNLAQQRAADTAKNISQIGTGLGGIVAKVGEAASAPKKEWWEE